MPSTYAFDPTGNLPANRVIGEQQIITAPNHRNFHFLVPTFAPFFANSIIVTFRDTSNVVRTLVEGIDYYNSFQYLGASRACAAPIYGGISFLDLTLTGVIILSYNTIGGPWTISAAEITTILSDAVRNPRVTSWELVTGIPTLFPVVDHEWNQQDLIGMSDVVEKIDLISSAISLRPAPPSVFTLSEINNKDQIGLGNVDNFKTATDADSVAGSSITKYMTPFGVKKAIQGFLSAFMDAANALAIYALPTGAGSIGTQTGQTLAEATLTVSTMAALRELLVPTVALGKTIHVIVLGELYMGDERPGRYYWVENSNLIDDGINVIVPNSTPATGRWINVEKDSWLVTSFVATANQGSFVITKAPLYNKPPKIVVNKTIDLVHTVDFNINGKTIIFHYPLSSNDVVDICIQLKVNTANFDNSWVYGKFAVTGPSQTFTLTNPPRDPRELRVILNDFIILNYSDDWMITNNLMSISYPILNGDTIEIMSIASLPITDMFYLRGR